MSGSKEGGSQRGSLRDFTTGATREGITNLRSSLSGAPEAHSPTSAASHSHSALNGKLSSCGASHVSAHNDFGSTPGFNLELLKALVSSKPPFWSGIFCWLQLSVVHLDGKRTDGGHQQVAKSLVTRCPATLCQR